MQETVNEKLECLASNAPMASDARAFFQQAPSPVYGEQGVTLRFRCADRWWRPVGILVRFVAVLHPQRGAILLMCTDLTLEPLDLIRLYGLRFQIEVSFQQPSASSVPMPITSGWPPGRPFAA
jgi:hypothetical protein